VPGQEEVRWELIHYTRLRRAFGNPKKLSYSRNTKMGDRSFVYCGLRVGEPVVRQRRAAFGKKLRAHKLGESTDEKKPRRMKGMFSRKRSRELNASEFRRERPAWQRRGREYRMLKPEILSVALLEYCAVRHAVRRTSSERSTCHWLIRQRSSLLTSELARNMLIYRGGGSSPRKCFRSAFVWWGGISWDDGPGIPDY